MSWPCRPKGDELAGASEAGTAGGLACMGLEFIRPRLRRSTVLFIRAISQMNRVTSAAVPAKVTKSPST